MPFLRPLFLSACLTLAALPAGAKDAKETGVPSPAPQACVHDELIVGMALDTLEVRAEMGGFYERRFGALEAFLLLHYGDLSVEDGLRLIEKVETQARRGPRWMDALKANYLVRHLGVEAGLAALGDDPVAVFAGLGVYGERAVMLADDGRAYFDLIAQVRAREDLAEQFDQHFVNGVGRATLLLDQEDDTKLRLARTAETAGHLPFAARLLASRADLTEYRAFLKRHWTEKDGWSIAPGMMALEGLFLEHFAALPAFPEIPKAPPSLAKPALYDSFRAGFFGRQVDFLNIVLNQTGREVEVGEVARRYLDALEAGALLPAHDVETAWLFQFEGLVEALGEDEARRVMRGFDLSSTARHFATSAADTMDWLIAKRALAPYMRGEVDDLPARPALLPDGWQTDDGGTWTSWQELAQATRARRDGGRMDLDALTLPIVVELLYLEGDLDRLRSLLKSHPASSARLGSEIRRDLLVRLDRQCRSVTVAPGQAILLGGQVPYRFD